MFVMSPQNESTSRKDCHSTEKTSRQKAFWTQHNDHMRLPCLQLRPSHTRFPRNILANELPCPACIGVRLYVRIATHHDLAKWTVACLRLTFFNRQTEPCTWITSQVLHMTTLWPARQVKDPFFPQEPHRDNARKSRGIKRRQMRWHRKRSQVRSFL